MSEVDGFIYRVFTAYDHPAYSLTMKDDLTGTNTIFAFTTRQLQNSEGNDGGIEVKNLL